MTDISLWIMLTDLQPHQQCDGPCDGRDQPCRCDQLRPQPTCCLFTKTLGQRQGGEGVSIHRPMSRRLIAGNQPIRTAAGQQKIGCPARSHGLGASVWRAAGAKQGQQPLGRDRSTATKPS